MSKTRTKYFVDIITSESWEGKNGAPNLWTKTESFEKIEEARSFIQNELAKIISNPANKIEWIDWRRNLLEIRFNYTSDSINKIHQSCSWDILEIEGNSRFRSITDDERS